MLSARFDAAALRPPARLPLPPSPDPRWAQLSTECRAAPQEPLRVAKLPHWALEPAALHAWLRELDADLPLERASALGRMGLKLRAKLQDLGWGSAATAIWDCGFLGEAALPALAQFRPRRPTVIVLDPMPQPHVDTALQTLVRNAPQFARPVRVWVPPQSAPPEPTDPLK
ncbi:hypothetical protein HNQ51_002298 [Inhella inkyongensis]|uniref:Uncharacterized protein n=2 Tax=Inhella inkyongensis TaxID=392593 RepID=A0A840S989_9BURK|nr:hypothetical protein [Inhella inkyongensis]MBB5204979.1 hypothetical protein [Inhella inkyongensis]